jgi:hypothetical protein
MFHPEYFFPFWAPKFPERSELIEIRGRLSFSPKTRAKGSHSKFHMGIPLVCKSGAGWFYHNCPPPSRDNKGPWKNAVARYHPTYGLIELEIDGKPVPRYTYEQSRDFVKKMGKSQGRQTLFFSVTLCLLLFGKYRVYRRQENSLESSTL